MGGAKRMMEEDEQKTGMAIYIAVQANTLNICPAHETVMAGSADIQNAYKLGNSMFSEGKLEGVFESRREMTDYIKGVFEDNYGNECYLCASIRDE